MDSAVEDGQDETDFKMRISFDLRSFRLGIFGIFVPKAVRITETESLCNCLWWE